MDSVNAPAPQRSFFGQHRLWLPTLIILIVGGLQMLPKIWHELDRPAETLMSLHMAAFFAIPLGFLAILGWWLILSRFRIVTKLAGIGAVAAVITAFVFSVRKVEATSGDGGAVHMHFTFKWDPDPKAILEEYRSNNPTPTLRNSISLKIDATDFPRYRGSRFDGSTEGAPLAESWATSPPKVLWKHPVGGGYAGCAVAGNLVVTAEQRDANESIVAYDRATGVERWVYTYPAIWKDLMGDGPRATPTIDGDAVYSLGATGDLVCLDGLTGTKRWTVNLLADNAAKNIVWGLSGSPLVVDDLVIVNAGIDPLQPAGKALAAYDRKTGEKRWATGNAVAGYSSPQLATLAGVKHVLLFDGAGLASYDPVAGKPLWNYAWKTYSDMNIMQPLVIDRNRVFISSEIDNGCAMLRIDKTGDTWSVSPIWQTKSLAARFASPVLTKAGIFGLHNGQLVCVDIETGERKWRSKRNFRSGQILHRGEMLIVTSDDGKVVLVEANADEYLERGVFEVFREKMWNTHALAGNELFVRTQSEMASLEVPTLTAVVGAK